MKGRGACEGCYRHPRSAGPAARAPLPESTPVEVYFGKRTWTPARSIATTHYDSQRKGIFAHTSPIYVSCGGDWRMFDEDTARHMLAVLDGDLAYIRQVSVQNRPGTVTHHHGEEDHTAYLERPFHEAREAIHGRMRGLGVAQ